MSFIGETGVSCGLGMGLVRLGFGVCPELC